jgi:hypothetical protein
MIPLCFDTESILFYENWSIIKGVDENNEFSSTDQKLALEIEIGYT